MSQKLYDTIQEFIENNLETYQENALKIHSTPEVSNYEFESSKVLADQLEK